MSDNTTRFGTSGGDTIRSDDLSGSKAQVFKLGTGTDGQDDGVATIANPYDIDASPLWAEVAEKLGRFTEGLSAKADGWRKPRGGGSTLGVIRSLANSAPSFDPAALSLDLWLRGSFSASPWVPTSSAGGSGSAGNFAEATNPPAPGTAENGFTPAVFDGVTSVLVNANPISTNITAAQWGAAVLFYANSALVASSPAYNDAVLIGDGLGFWGLYINASGVVAYQTDGVGAQATAPSSVSFGAWHLAIGWFDGININLDVDGVLSTPVAAGNVNNITGGGQTGISAGGTPYDGRLMEVMATKGAEFASPSTRANLRAYVSSRYAMTI